MDFEKIEDYSFWYNVGRIHATFGQNYLFYKKVYVTGKENIPENEAVILAGNHQNALMDAMAIICTHKWQPVFLARSDIFGKPAIAKSLIAMKILPVYRIRDGKESLKNNEQIFNKNVEILKKKKFLALMPEASHEGIRKLRTINKGISRIAFQAEEESDFNLNLKIIPVGINYTNYFKFRSILQVNYGKPIQINDLKDEFYNNPTAAHLEVRRRLEEGMKPLMINIENDEFYDMYEDLRIIYDDTMMNRLQMKNKSFKNKFVADKKMIDALDSYEKQNKDGMLYLKEKVNFYSKGLKNFKINDWLFEKKKSWIFLILQALFLLITSPFAIYGIINNFIPYNTPKLITRKFKDRHFHTSLEFVIWLFLYPIFYIIMFFIAWAVTDIWWIKWAYFVSLPLSAFFYFWYWRMCMKFFGKIRYYFSFNSPKMRDLRKTRQEIILKVNEIVDKFGNAS